MRRADFGAVVFALCFPTLITLVYFVWLATSRPSLQQTAYTVGKILQFGFPLFWVFLVQRRRLTWKWPGTKGLAEGATFGLIVFAAMVSLYYGWLKPNGHLAAAEVEVRAKVAGFGLSSLAMYIGLGAFYSLCHSLLEEYYWRWFVFGQLRDLIPKNRAVLISSIGFMAHHVIVLATYFGWFSLATALFSLAVAIGGAAWAWIYQRSGSLLSVWISHLLVDAAIFTIGYDMVGTLFSS